MRFPRKGVIELEQFQGNEVESRDMVVPSQGAGAGALLGDLVAIRVHAGHDVDARVVQQVAHVRIHVVARQQVRYQVHHQLPTHRLRRNERLFKQKPPNPQNLKEFGVYD